MLSTGLVTEVERAVYALVDLLACSCIWLSWIRCDVVFEEAMKDGDLGLRRFGITNMTIIKVVLASSQAGHRSVTH